MPSDLTQQQIDRRIHEIARLVVSNPYKPRARADASMADQDHGDHDTHWPRHNFDRSINDSRILLAESYALLKLINQQLGNCGMGVPPNPA
jgi:hypothetical protein